MAEGKAGSTSSVRKGKVHVLLKTDRGLFPFSVLRKYETEAKSERLMEEKKTRALDQHGLVRQPFRAKSLLDLQDNCTYFDACVRQIAKDVIGRAGALDIAGRFIRAGLPAPRQLILDEGQDLNEFYNLTKGKP